jgi:trigger factor
LKVIRELTSEETALNVTVETTPQSDAQFHIQIPWSEIDKASERVYKRLAQQHTVPGFRPGRAPRTMLERMVGRDVMYEEAIDIIVDDAVRKAANSHELTILSAPHAHVHEIKYGEEHEVTVTIPVLAKGELADYHDIRVVQEEANATDEQIDAVIDKERDRLALWVPVERPAQIGDRVTVDLNLTVIDKQVSDLKDNEFELVAERTGIFTGMDDQVVGMVDGETKEFTLTVPEDYGKAEMAGQEAHYTVILHKTTIKELPAVDEDLAKKIGNYDSVEAMRDGIREKLTRDQVSNNAQKARTDLMDELIKRLTLIVPPVLIEVETNDMVNEIASLLGGQGMEFEQFLSLTGKTLDQYKEEVKPDAEKRIYERRALELLAEQESLDVTSQELQTLLDMYAAGNPRASRTRLNQLKPHQRLNLELSIKRNKAIEWLTTNCIAKSENDIDEEVAISEESSVSSAQNADIGEKDKADAGED